MDVRAALLAGSALLPPSAAYLCLQVFPPRRRGCPPILPRSPWPPSPKPSAVIQASRDTRGPVCAGDGEGGLWAVWLSSVGCGVTGAVVLRHSGLREKPSVSFLAAWRGMGPQSWEWERRGKGPAWEGRYCDGLRDQEQPLYAGGRGLHVSCAGTEIHACSLVDDTVRPGATGYTV